MNCDRTLGLCCSSRFSCLRRARLLACVGISLATLGLPALAQDGIDDLGTLGGSTSTAWGVSADGSVVAGHSTITDNTATTHAFRWTNSAMTDLGTLGGTSSAAYGVSADGSVVAGYAETSNRENRAFRWIGNNMTDLGTLGGTDSYAYGISGNGAVVVGEASTVENASSHAFRWTNNVMTDLGTLGGRDSYAWGASTDGTVVAGHSMITGDTTTHAFRWTNNVMTDLGTLGGRDSYAYRVSASGTVVIGESLITGNTATHAFRWTDNVMTDLGTLGGTNSHAYGISADGAVVVGKSHAVVVGKSQIVGQTYRAFRWTQAGGMQSVEDWLRTGGVNVPIDITASALGANSDGSAVVGKLENNHAFIARLGLAGSGLVTLADVQESLAGTSRGGSTALTAAGLVLNGAHSRPLSRRVAMGQKIFWLAGDWSADDHGDRSGDLGVTELGLGRNFGMLQINVSLGQTWAKQSQTLNGQTKADGTYLLAEVLTPVQDNLWAIFDILSHKGEADLKRGYLNAGAQDYSIATPATDAWSLRARLEWESAWRSAVADFTPYADLAWATTRLDAYTETGGGFPARFDARKEKATELRLGVHVQKPLVGGLNLVSTLEAAHRFERSGSRTSGEVIGLFGFDLAGQPIKRNWLRVGIGAEGKLAEGITSLMLNATTQAEVPSAWLAANWQRAF